MNVFVLYIFTLIKTNFNKYLDMLVFKKFLSEQTFRSHRKLLLVIAGENSSTQKLEPDMQKAIIAYYIIEYITFFSPESYKVDSRSIRERMLDRKTFNKFVLSQLIKYSSKLGIKQHPTEEWLN